MRRDHEKTNIDPRGRIWRPGNGNRFAGRIGPIIRDNADLIKSAIILTGIYELEPLRKTTINDAVGIDEWTAADYSPLYLSPTSSAPLLVSLGGAETNQFHQQSRNFVAEWAQYDMEMAQHIEPGVDHFDVVNRLADPESELFKRARSWLR